MMLRALVVVSSLLLVLPAQGERPVQKPGAGARKAAQRGDGDAINVGDVHAKLTPEQRALAASGVRRGSASFCQFHMHTKPTKLMPGESGTMIVTMVMKGQAVLPSPAPLEVTSAAQQGPITFGAPSFRPAGVGRLAPAYVGRPVYDNYAILELPITMAGSAVVGQEHHVNVEMKFDLFDGTSAQNIGSFLDRAVGKVAVGQSFDPAVRGGYTPPVRKAAPDANPRGAGQVEQANPETPAALGAAPTLLADEQPVETQTNEPVEPTAMPQVEDDPDNLWLLIALGGAALAAAGLLLLKRR